MTDIPDELMAYAKEFWRQGGAVEASPPLAIARAILAERERCAQIAEAMPWHIFTSQSHVRGLLGQDVADAIRNSASKATPTTRRAAQ